MKHVYRNNVIDWYVATSPEHAAELCRAHELSQGVEPEDIGPEFIAERLTFTMEPDDKPLRIDQSDDAPKGEPRKVTKTCAQWAAENEPGMLCSTEW